MKRTRLGAFLLKTVSTISLLAVPAAAGTITYTDYVEFLSVQVGSTSYACTSLSDPNCAFVTITATGNTADVQPFSVVGASGFKNTNLTDITVSIFFLGGMSLMETLLPGQIYVSVDQTNSGAGFGSSFSPTYPASTYGGSSDYTTYDLASDFYVFGYSGFCPVLDVCNSGPALHTASGNDISLSYPFRPNFSRFYSTVVPDETPEPASAALLGVALTMLTAWRVKRRGRT